MPEQSDCDGYGKFEQACSVEQSYFAAAAETIGTELVIKQYLCPFLTSITPLRMTNTIDVN